MPVVKLFMSYPKLYSWKYITFMKSELNDKGLTRIKSTEGFLNLMSNDKVLYSGLSLPMQFQRFFEMKSGSLSYILNAAQ